MGSAKITYSFPNMSDFQYLPTERVMEKTSVSPTNLDIVQDINFDNKGN